jgi:hypothetical protein
MATIIEKPSFNAPSFCSMTALACTVLWFGCIVVVLNGNSDLNWNSVFIALVTSIIFLMSAHALVRGTFGRCR